MNLSDEATKQMNRPKVEDIIEAKRSKAMAVSKYQAGDLVGAKEFALKAQKLYPSLAGVTRLNAVLHVRISFGKKINGEVDWYGVLGVDPTADNQTVYKGYMKLVDEISFDIDSSVGSIEEAKKILDDSWNVLLDERSRQLYDKRRQSEPQLDNLRRVPPNVMNNNNSSSSANGGSSFWTTCHFCSTQYEYPNKCKYQRLICVNCSKPFEAIQCPAPSMTRDNPWRYAKQQRKRANVIDLNKQKRMGGFTSKNKRVTLLGKAKSVIKLSLGRYVSTAATQM